MSKQGDIPNYEYWLQMRKCRRHGAAAFLLSGFLPKITGADNYV